MESEVRWTLPVWAAAVWAAPSASPSPNTHAQANGQHMLCFNTRKHPTEASASLAVAAPANKRSAQGTVRPISRREHLGLNDVYIFVCGQLTFPRKPFAVPQRGQAGLSGGAEQGEAACCGGKRHHDFPFLPDQGLPRGLPSCSHRDGGSSFSGGHPIALPGQGQGRGAPTATPPPPTDPA